MYIPHLQPFTLPILQEIPQKPVQHKVTCKSNVMINLINHVRKVTIYSIKQKKSYLIEIAFFKNKIIYPNKLLRLQHLNLFYLLVIRIQLYHFL